MRSIVTIIFGIVFVFGGLTGNLVLIGTNSGTLLAVVGIVLVGWGVYRLGQEGKV